MSMFIFSAPFPGHTNAVIVTPTPLKADVVPNAGVVIAPSHLGGVCSQLCHLHCSGLSVMKVKIDRVSSLQLPAF